MNVPAPKGFVIEIEQEVLGALLGGGDFRKVSGILQSKHFLEQLHQRLFDVIRAAHERYNSTTVPVVAQLVPDDLAMAVKAHIGPINNYLASLVANTVYGNGGLERNARAIVAQWARVQIAEEAGRVHAAASDPATDPIELATACGQAFDDILSDVRAGPRRRTRVLVQDAAQNAIAAAREARQRGSGLTGVTWGLTDVNRLTGGIQKRDLTLIAARPSMGKAQPLTAKVRTPRGWTTMGRLRVGDHVSSVDGSPSVVTGVFPQGEKQIYRITFSDGRSTRCCGDHLWRVHYRNWDGPRVLSTLELTEKLSRVRYQHRLWIDQIEPSGVEDPSLPIDPWALGALLGDGGLTGGTVKFSSACSETIDRMASRIPDACRIDRITGTEYDHVITMREKVRMPGGWLRPNCLVEAINALGLGGHKSETKFIPRQYLDAGPSQRLDMLRGLLDTDGWVERHGTVCFCTTSKQLAEDVCELARSLGAWCSIRPRQKLYTYKGEKKAGLPAYTCVIGHPDPASLFLMTSKVGATKGRSRRKLPIIVKVEQDGFEDAQCISVSHPSKLYVTDDYIVTHNTSAGLGVALRAGKSGHGVGFISLEMDAEKLAARAISDLAFDWSVRVPYADIIKGTVSDDDISHVEQGSREIERMPLWIEDQPGQSMTDIRVKAESMMQQAEQAGFPLELLVVDHMGLIRPSSRYQGNRVNEVAEISAGLKSLAREYGIAVLALSQLSRALETRNDKRPQLSDLRDSGAIEQDADTIVFLYREAYYLEREKGLSPEAEVERVEKLVEAQHKLEFAIAKQRNGPVSTVDLYVEMACSAVRNGSRR